MLIIEIDSRPVVALIPCRNEAASIVAVIEGLRAIGINKIVIGLDPKNTDDTPMLAERAGAMVVKAESSGYDGPCLASIDHLRAIGFAGSVLFLDAGNKYVMETVGALVAGLDPTADITFGVRDRQMRWHQRLGNKFFHIVLYLRFRHWVTDVSSLRVVKMSVLEELQLEDRQFSLPFQTIVHALMLHKKIRYTPIRCTQERTGTSKVSGDVRNSLKAARQMALSLFRTPKFDQM